MSYLIRSLAHNVTKLGYNSVRCRSDLLLRSNPSFICLLSCNAHTQARIKENSAVDQYIRKLDSDARKLGRLSYNDVESVFEIMKATRSASVTQSLMIIRCCGSLLIEETTEKRTKLVQEMWRTLESLGVNLDISHYNALLRVYLENEYDFLPTDILADLEKRGLEPNRVTYQRLITRYCQKGDIGGATRILEFMREKEMPVNVTVFNALIMGHSQSNDMVSAEGILSVMKQANIESTGETHAQLICGYIKQGDLEKAKEILQNCEACDVGFSDRDYFDVIFSLTSYGYEEEVDQIIPKLRRIPGYNQEAMNCIYRLLSIGKTETSFKILKTLVRATRSDGSLLPVGSFFVAQLIRLDLPPETVTKYCQELIKENMNQFALNVAMENSLRFQKKETALGLFKFARENGVVIRQHFFWPLLAMHGKKHDKSGIFDILIKMQEFDMPANTETLREFVIPYLMSQDLDVETVLMDLKGCGCTIASGVCSIVHHYLILNNIQKAATVAQTYHAFYSPFIFRRPLVNAYVNSKDTKSFVSLLRETCAGIHWRASLGAENVDDEDAITNVPDHREHVGRIVKDVIYELKNDRYLSDPFKRLLEEMVNQGIGLTSTAAQQIQQMLQDQLTSDVSELLEKLTSDELASLVTSPKDTRISISALDETSLERLRDTMLANNESLTGVHKHLYILYARNKNLDKLLALKEQMDAENFIYTTGMKALLIDTYVANGKLDEALQLYDACCQANPDFNLNPVKVLRLALLLVQNDNIEKATEVLKKKCAEVDNREVGDDSSFLPSSLCWRLLNFFAEKGDVDRVNEFFNLLIEQGLTEVNTILLGPLIKVHLQRNDLDKAMEVFEMCCQKYRATPFKSELARMFVEREDATNLQKLTDLSTPIHGEVNSLYDLMLSFLECGRVRQAKKILETPGLRLRHDRIENACNKYTNEGAVDHLENMLVLTKDIGLVNRSELYNKILQAHDRSDDPQKALGLWMQMQEEDVQPSAQFLYLLASILKRHLMEVPFTIPSETEALNSTDANNRDKIRVSRTSQTLRKLLNSGDFDQALQYKEKIGAEKFNKTDWSLLIEGGVKQNRFKDAVQLFNEYYSRSFQLPHVKHFRILLKAAVRNADLDFFNKLRDSLSNDIKKHVSFETQRARAHLIADKLDVYIAELEEKLNKVKTESEFKKFEAEFPKGGFLAVLTDRPEYHDKIKSITTKCEEQGWKSTVLDNFWWSHLLATRQIDAAQKLWDERLKSCPEAINFGTLARQIQRESDVELGKAFLSMIRSKANVSPGVLGIAYGTLISALTQRNAVNEALQCLNEAVENIPMSSVVQSSVVLLKSACDAKNIPFPYNLQLNASPRKQREEDISESDSD